MKSSNVIKVIRICVFAVALLIVLGVISDVIVMKYVDSIKIRDILYRILLIVALFPFIILIQNPKLAVLRVTILDILCITILIVSIAAAFTQMRKESLILTDVIENLEGNNWYSSSYYSNGMGNRGFDDIESAFENAIKEYKQSKKMDNLEELYQIQAGEYIFAYYKENEKSVVEFTFFKQDDLYYCLGRMCVGELYDDKCTAEDTIRADIVHTMSHGRKWGETALGAPAWGVSTDENIFSMTINSENVDDVILINEIDGKKYYFWITTNVDGIETIDDVKAAEIEM